jgi:metal-responsive CopG/Arc/MetJ family transcriptional regulator
MAKATNSISTTIRVRLPRELLAVIDEWATAHDLPRSKAIQALLLRGLAWEEAQQRQQQLAA